MAHQEGSPRSIPTTVSTHLCIDFVNSRFNDHTGSRCVHVKRLLPQALQSLDDALRLTPVERLDGVAASHLITGPPDDRRFGLGTRTRASLLFGLPVTAS